jgi:uncharacterized protein YlxP (DUF503 family)
MVVGVCRITLMVPESQSLKDRRSVVHHIKDRVRQKFNVAIADVGDQDAWQSAQLGFAVVANEKAFVASIVDKVAKFIEDVAEAKVIDDEKDYVEYGDGELRSDGWTHWETDEPSPVGNPFGDKTPAASSRRRRGIPVRGARKKS